MLLLTVNINKYLVRKVFFYSGEYSGRAQNLIRQ